MTSPNLNVDHQELVTLADGHVLLIDELTNGAPPQVAGEWPSMAAAQAALGATHTSRTAMAARLGSNADTLRGAAAGYAGQEHDSGAKLGDIAQLLGSLANPAAGVLGQVAAAVGNVVGPGVGGALGPINGWIGAVSSAHISAAKGGGSGPDVEPDTGLLGPDPATTAADPPPGPPPQHPMHAHEGHGGR